jgi:hypothetical protein
LLKYSPTQSFIMRIVFIVIIAAGIIAVALVAMFASALPTKDYNLSVDALKDEQSLFTNARVVVKNTGRLPLTNVLVDYGSEMEPPIDKLQPGDTRTLSPPEGVQLDQVTVTADPSIEVVQFYRTPWKLPGMIGS